MSAKIQFAKPVFTLVLTVHLILYVRPVILIAIELPLHLVCAKMLILKKLINHVVNVVMLVTPARITQINA
jgi:hypothetical protein